MTAPDPGFWRGRRVLVTGHSGFKGSWLSLWLSALGAEIAGFSAGPPTEPSLYALANAGEGMRETAGDVRDLGALERAMRAHRPEMVLHLAAQPLVRRSYRDPAETFAVNTGGTANVLEAVRRVSGVRVVVVATTDKVYTERDDGEPHREGDPLGGLDPYSASKACAELVSAAYRESFFDGPGGGTALATARAGNVIGGGDWGADRLVPDLVRAATGGGSPLELRNPDAVRPWQHVLNPLNGYLALAEMLWDDPALAGAWNFGPERGDEWPVRRVAERFAELWGEPVPWGSPAGEQPREAPALRLDSAKARQQLRWTPVWDLEAGIDATVSWHRSVRAGEDPRAVSLGQIEGFTEEA